jgi:hypothetical protein
MDHDQWRMLMACLGTIVAALPRPSKRFSFSDTLVVGMYLWAVAHDRPMRWACERSHYNAVFRPRQLPSVSQFHRRVRSDRVRLILQRLHNLTAGALVPTALLSIDGKALPISPVSKDPDARFGYAGGRTMGRGFKLHALVSEDRRILSWCVRPMNEHEMPIACELIGASHHGLFTPRTLVLADGNYDSHVMHKAVDRRGGRLVTHLRGKGKHEVTLRQMGAARRELLKVSEQSGPLLRMIRRHRNVVELTFSNLTSYGGGLGPLPPFVRRLSRVTRWVGSKIILYHTRLQARRQCERGE